MRFAAATILIGLLASVITTADEKPAETPPEATSRPAEPGEAAKLAALLGHSSWRVRLDAVRTLDALSDRDAVAVLIGALDDRDWHVRHAAATALADWHDARITRATARLLTGDEPVPSVRLQATRALAIQEDRQAVPALIRVLGDAYWQVRLVAARALEPRKDPRSFWSLVDCLTDEITDIRVTADKTIGTMDSEALPPTAKLLPLLESRHPKVISAVARLLMNRDLEYTVVPLLVAAAGVADSPGSSYLSSCLDRIHDPRAVPMMLEALRSPNSRLRRRIAERLRTLANETSHGPMLRAMSDAEPHVREGVALALGSVLGKAALGPLMKAASDPDAAVRRAAVTGLLNTRSRAAGDPLAELAASDDAAIQYEAAKALVELDDVRAVPVLAAKLKDTTDYRRREAVSQLATLGSPDAVRALAGTLQSTRRDVTVQYAAAQVLVKLADPAATDTLIAAVKHKDARISMYAATALAATGGEKARAALRSVLMTDKRPAIQAAAAGALIGPPEPAVIERLIGLMTGSGSYARGAVAKVLARHGTAKAMDALLGALRHRYWPVQVSAIEALGTTGSEKAVDPLIEATKSSRAQVRQAAAVALGELKIPRATDALIRAITDSNLTAHAIAALGRTGDPRAIAPLKKQLAGDNWETRKHAALALCEIGTAEATAAAASALWSVDSTARIAILKRLGKLGGPKAIDTLRRALGNEPNAPTGTFILRPDQMHPDHGAYGAAARALRGTGEAEAVRLARSAVRKWAAALDEGKMPDDEMRHLIVRLAYSGDPAALPALAKVADAGRRIELRVTAVAAIGRLDGPEARAALMAYAEHDHVDLRETAVQALMRRGDDGPSTDQLQYWRGWWRRHKAALHAATRPASKPAGRPGAAP